CAHVERTDDGRKVRAPGVRVGRASLQASGRALMDAGVNERLHPVVESEPGDDVPVRARLPLRQHENRNALRERPDAVSRRYRCGSSRLGTRRSMDAGRHLRSRYGRLRIAYGADRAVLPPAAPHGPGGPGDARAEAISESVE